MILVERSPKLYVKKYFEGEDFTNAGMILGKQLAEALEDDIESDIPIIEQARIFLVAYPKKEYELKVKVDGLVLLGKPDTYDPWAKRFREYKSGKTPWTQKKVDNCDQITFYAMLTYFKYKKLPKEMHLDWINTDEESKGYGQIKTFETTRTVADILKMFSRAKKAWQVILELSEENITT